MLIESLVAAQQLALEANAFDYDFETPTTKREEPGDDGVFDIGFRKGTAPNQIKIHPFGEGPPGSVFVMRLSAWTVFGTDTNKWVWSKSLLAQLNVTLGNQRGFDGALIKDFEFLAGAIGVAAGAASVYNPPYFGVACAFVPLFGCHKLQFEFNNLGQNIAMNAIWSRA